MVKHGKYLPHTDWTLFEDLDEGDYERPIDDFEVVRKRMKSGRSEWNEVKEDESMHDKN